MNWIDALKADLSEQFGNAPQIITLATIADHMPHARSIVLRDLSDAGEIVFTSDSRSEKNAQLQANSNAAVVIWLPKLKRQYRLNGWVEILDHADSRCRQMWERSSDASRAMFLWPSPEIAYDFSINTPAKVAAEVAIPDCFSVLVFHPERVDTLDLTSQPHLRTRWTIDAGEWNSARINP